VCTRADQKGRLSKAFQRNYPAQAARGINTLPYLYIQYIWMDIHTRVNTTIEEKSCSGTHKLKCKAVINARCSFMAILSLLVLLANVSALIAPLRW
jgi:hypothetical protein